MKRFILNTLFFLLFVGVAGYIIHLCTQTLPNDYTYKNECLEKNASSVKILNLGNSQSLYAINPAYFSKKGFNLAHVSQTLDIDYLLLEKHIDRLDSLEYLIIQLSYTSFFETLGYGSEAWRVKNYERFYRINPPFDQSKEFNSVVITERNNLLRLYEYIRGVDGIHCNSYGFDESFSYRNRETDFTGSAARAAEWHIAGSYEFVPVNYLYLSKMIEMAQQKNIRVILFIPPVHHTYQELLNQTQLDMMYKNIDGILKKYNNIIFLDWSKNDYFADSDFFDCDHLNDKGAEKLTLLLDSLLQ